MKISDINKESCCGCTGCLCVCPKSAISMKTDDQGFEYPEINENLCVDCGLCYNVCKNSSLFKYPILECYAAKNSNADVVMSSSSGGLVDALCNVLFEEQGVVYGAAYNDNFELVYKRAQNIDESIAFRGSKYVQASLGTVFQDVLQDLNNEKKVLFIGPSCFLAGLYSYLDSKKCCINNLFTVDFICHGVPSPGIFKQYVQYVNNNSSLSDIVFRNKKDKNGRQLHIPWKYGRYNCALIYKNGYREVNTLKSRIFLNLFTSNNCLRPHCYQCRFIGIEKPGDITVADYWGIEEVHSDFADNNGVSAIMIHSEKGTELFKKCHNIEYIVSSIDKISLKQGMLRSASPKGKDYDEFWNDFYNKGFAYIAKKYGEYSILGKVHQSKLYSIYSKIRYGE